MRAHGLPAAAKDHRGTGDRAAALDVLTKPLGIVLTPGPVVGAMYQWPSTLDADAGKSRAFA